MTPVLLQANHYYSRVIIDERSKSRWEVLSLCFLWKWTASDEQKSQQNVRGCGSRHARTHTHAHTSQLMVPFKEVSVWSQDLCGTKHNARPSWRGMKAEPRIMEAAWEVGSAVCAGRSHSAQGQKDEPLWLPDSKLCCHWFRLREASKHIGQNYNHFIKGLRAWSSQPRTGICITLDSIFI